MADPKADKPAGKRAYNRKVPVAVVKTEAAKPVAPAVVAPAKQVPPVPVKAAAPVVSAPKVTAPEPVPAPVIKPVVEAKPEAKPIVMETPVAVVEVVKSVAEVAVQKTAAATAEIAETAETVVKTAALPIQKGFFAMTDKLTPQSFVPTPENVKALFSDFSTRTKAAVEKSTKIAEELGEFAKGNVEALITSGRVAAKGAETIGQEAADYSKKSFETATTAVKGFAAAKSPTELFKLQSDYARSAFDAAVAEGSKFSESLLKLFGEIAQPISTRVAVAAEKIKTPAF